MKRNTLQMLKCIEKNEKRMRLILSLLTKSIQKKIGKQKRGNRRMNLTYVVAGILYYLRTGCTWRALPTEFGKKSTLAGWFNKLSSLKAFEDIWQELLLAAHENKILKLSHILGDGSLAMTQSNIPIKSRNPRIKNKNVINRMILTDKRGTLIGFSLEKGTANDTNFLLPLVDSLQQKIRITRSIVHADKGFDSLKNRLGLLERGLTPEIPVRRYGYDPKNYPKQKDEKRPLIERSFAWLNSFKALRIVAIQKVSNLYEAFYFACIMILSRLFRNKMLKIKIEAVK